MTSHRFNVTDYYRMGDLGILGERADKRALYAEAGIAEYWVIDVQAKKLARFLREGKEQPVSAPRLVRQRSRM